MCQERNEDQEVLTQDKRKTKKVYGVLECHENLEELEEIKEEPKKKGRPFVQWLTGIAVASLCIGVGIGSSLSLLIPYGANRYLEKHSGSKMGKHESEAQLAQNPLIMTPSSQVKPYDNGILPQN